MKKAFDIFFSFELLSLSYFVLVEKKIIWMGKDIDFSNPFLCYPIGSFIFMLGALWLYSSFRNEKWDK